MKQLIVMRHAKSDWGAGARDDHSRPLNERGRTDAPKMGRLLTMIGMVPDLVVTSTAVRAHTTAQLAAERGGWAAPVTATDEFYGASPYSMLQHISTTPDDVNRLMVVGHQPTLSGLVGVLSGGAVAVRTATVVILDLLVGQSWATTEPPHGEVVAVLQPRHIRGLNLDADPQ